ncbi:hypothetical protein GVM20_04550 [Porphyrobacter sp. SLTP]|uniref:hypothetical protein n=1 Tax=Porphyrobacter sp. SLTP TaxID=2683266 RepID=UPI001411ED36|nr:hypothetical protein [Porphyrobacter sp. SLTP]NBB24393.1 hypothetical protein [Porphyrobacter sp. SLTP]
MKDYSKRSSYPEKIDPVILVFSSVFSRVAETASDAEERQYFSELAIAAASHRSPLYPWLTAEPVFRSVEGLPVVDFAKGLAFVWIACEAGYPPRDGAWSKSPELLDKESILMSRDEFAARFPGADLSLLPAVEVKMPPRL